MVKCRMMVLAEREKTNVAAGWKLQHATETIVSERKRES
jgi:hypothetical protein